MYSLCYEITSVNIDNMVSGVPYSDNDYISFLRSPGWRPTFKYYNRWLSLLGTVICLAVMFLMDYRTAIATYIIILLLYIVIHNRNPEANWGSSAQSLTFLQALRSVHTLAQVDDHVKNYRPKVIALILK